jgi:hypothetical protein
MTAAVSCCALLLLEAGSCGRGQFGTQRKGNVSRWKPLPSNGNGRLRRLWVCCGDSDLWSVTQWDIGTVVVTFCKLDDQSKTRL